MKWFEQFEKGLDELRKAQLKTDAQLAKTDAQLAKTDAQLAKTDIKLKETTQILSSIGINLGDVAEEFFYYSLKDKMTFGGLKFDIIDHNVNVRNKKVQDEFDIIMYNGNSIGIIEIKHKVHPNDIEKLTTNKVANFRILFPDYADYRIFLGIGGMSIPKNVAEIAQAKGVAGLRQKGELLQIEDNKLKEY